MLAAAVTGTWLASASTVPVPEPRFASTYSSASAQTPFYHWLIGHGLPSFPWLQPPKIQPTIIPDPIQYMPWLRPSPPAPEPPLPMPFSGQMEPTSLPQLTPVVPFPMTSVPELLPVASPEPTNVSANGPVVPLQTTPNLFLPRAGTDQQGYCLLREECDYVQKQECDLMRGEWFGENQFACLFQLAELSTPIVRPATKPTPAPAPRPVLNTQKACLICEYEDYPECGAAGTSEECRNVAPPRHTRGECAWNNDECQSRFQAACAQRVHDNNYAWAWATPGPINTKNDFPPDCTTKDYVREGHSWPSQCDALFARVTVCVRGLEDARTSNFSTGGAGLKPRKTTRSASVSTERFRRSSLPWGMPTPIRSSSTRN